MKSQFAIFGLEKIHSPEPDDEKSGQPYLFRKYPDHFESLAKAYGALENITTEKSPYVRFRFPSYVVLEVFSISN
jgi:hypothetical protein